MGLLNTSTSNKNFIRNNKKGFTLIEITIVMALFAMILGLGLITGFDSYRRDALKAERNTLISILQKARSQAINNIDNSKHGFYFDGTNYIVFSGIDYNSRVQAKDLVVQKKSAIIVTGSTEIVFNQLTGDTTQTGDYLFLSDGISSSTISINQEGRIDW